MSFDIEKALNGFVVRVYRTPSPAYAATGSKTYVFKDWYELSSWIQNNEQDLTAGAR